MARGRSRKQKKERRYTSAKKRAETHKMGFGRTTLEIGKDVTFFALNRAGTRRIDVLPYVVGKGNPFAEPGELHYERTFFVHRGVGANNDTYVCPAKVAKKRCPVCEYQMKLRKDPDADEKLIKDLAAKERQLWNVIDKDEPEKGVQLWDISYHLFGRLLDTEIRNADEDEDFDSFFHLEDGKTLKLGIGEKSFGGRTFYEVETISFKPRVKDYEDDVLENCHVLDDLLVVLDYEKLKAIFLQTSDAEDVEEDGDDLQEPLPKTPSRKKAEKKDELDEDEWEDEDEERESTSDLSVGDEVGYKGEKCEVLRVGEKGVMLEGLRSGKIYKGVKTSALDDLKPDEDAATDEDEDDDWDEEPTSEPEKKKPTKKPPKGSSKTSAKKEKDVDEDEGDEDDDDWDDWD